MNEEIALAEGSFPPFNDTLVVPACLNLTGTVNWTECMAAAGGGGGGGGDSPGGGPGGLPKWLMVVIQVVYAMVCVVGLCGNTLVIYVVLRFSKMQTVTNIYILMLAAADECFLVGKRYSHEIYSTLQLCTQQQKQWLQCSNATT